MTEEEAYLWSSLLIKTSGSVFWSIQPDDATLVLSRSASWRVVYQSPLQLRPSVELMTNTAVARYLDDHLEQKYVFR